MNVAKPQSYTMPKLALSYGKGSLKDTKDGMFFGKNGSTGLGFSISRIRNDRRQSIGLTSGMFRILNARHAVTAQSRPVNLSYAVSTAKKALPAGVKTIQVQGVGGGGGQNEITGSLRTTSNNGTATTIHLYDGNTLKLTLTCPGGLGGTGGSADSRRSSAGRECLPLKGRRDRPLCRLPVSGWWGWGRPDVGGRIPSGTAERPRLSPPRTRLTCRIGQPDDRGDPRRRGARRSWTATAGPGRGFNNTAAVSFPSLGAGLWVLDTRSEADLSLDEVTIGPGTTIWRGSDKSTAFFSSQTLTLCRGG